MPPREGARIRCVAGENARPPDDVGGPNAYFDFVNTHQPHGVDAPSRATELCPRGKRELTVCKP